MRFLGNIEAKIDAKGRVFLPATFRKVLQAGGEENLVLRKDVFQPMPRALPGKRMERADGRAAIKAQPLEQGASAHLQTVRERRGSDIARRQRQIPDSKEIRRHGCDKRTGEIHRHGRLDRDLERRKHRRPVYGARRIRRRSGEHYG